MHDLSFRRQVGAVLILCALATVAVTPAFGWGSTGHTAIAKSALTLLPPEMKPFYEVNSRYVIAFAMLPDDWKQTHKEEGPNHYINMDVLEQPPFSNLVADRATVEKRFGKDKLLEAGVLPWAIEDHYKKLVDAFRRQDAQEIVIQSGVLAHYVGDAHVPMHSAKNYDGATKEAKGVHFRWEEALPAITLRPEEIRPVTPEKVDDIIKSAFKWCIESYNQLDAVYNADEKARKADPNDSFLYYRILSEETETVMIKQLTSASEALAGVYVAAWTEAGKPTLKKNAAALFWGH